MTYRVIATSLNLRSQPVVSPSTKRATLPHGHLVEKLGGSTNPDWWQVSTEINGSKVDGYVNHQYLQLENSFNEPAVVQGVNQVHLSTSKKILRAADGGRAFPLNETNQPRRTSNTAAGKVSELHQIINWLEVEKSPRYLPKSGTTYCNIYSYDYCYLANVYLPRVWWTSKAIAQLINGQPVSPIYDKTVTELNANSLHNWFAEFGDDFGWRRTFDLNELQEQANKGAVCIISARRKELNRPGHICAVAPETDAFKATRKSGVVTIPVQSNAGASNFRYGGRIWWTSENFSSFSFWIHE